MPHIGSVKPKFVLMKIMSDCIHFYVEIVHFIKCLENIKHNVFFENKLFFYFVCLLPELWLMKSEPILPWELSASLPSVQSYPGGPIRSGSLPLEECARWRGAPGLHLLQTFLLYFIKTVSVTSEGHITVPGIKSNYIQGSRSITEVFCCCCFFYIICKSSLFLYFLAPIQQCLHTAVVKRTHDFATLPLCCEERLNKFATLLLHSPACCTRH